MAMNRSNWKSLPVYIAILAICGVKMVSVTAERRVRHLGSGGSISQGHQNLRNLGPDRSSPNSLSSEDNGYSSEPEKKVSHRLIGGHMRYETTSVSPLIRESKVRNETESSENEEETDEANWDDGLIIASAGNGKEKNTRSEDDEEKKTLSQQVKEGKYGLIQNEIYPSKPKRPGIISYLPNPEVPKDTAKNLGGLDEEEIWLAENHVLVLRGGTFPDHTKDHGETSTNDWSPIDDYKAPKRQVKIPPSPKVPPPFPVQLSENGPIQIIGVNGSSVDDRSNKYEDEEYNKGFLPGEGPFFAISKDGSLAPTDLVSQENTTKKVANNDQEKKTKSGHVPPRKGGTIGPFYSSLPPGAVFVVPPSNQSDYDDDDQSIYYPPPYSFFYKQDNSTSVPPGPLVPGIILPPPPDFFSSLEEKKTTAKNLPTKYSKRPSTTPLPRINPTYYPPRKSSIKPYKGTTSSSLSGKVQTTKYTPRGSLTMKPVNAIKYKTTTERTTEKPIVLEVTSVPIEIKNSSPLIEVTTPSSNEATSLEITEFYTSRPNTLKNLIAKKTTNNRKNHWSPDVSSNPVPLVTYYSSSTPLTVDEPVEATPASVNTVMTSGKHRGTSNQASYYFYEEANEDLSRKTTPNPAMYYRATTEVPYYKIQNLPEEKQQERREHLKKSYYQSSAVPIQIEPKDYESEPIFKTSPRYRSPDPTANSIVSSRSNGQRMLEPSSPTYYEDSTENPRHRLESYYTKTSTEKPVTFSGGNQDNVRYNYHQGTKPKAIYQYSFESADYSKHGQRQQENYYKPVTQQPSYYEQETRQPTPEAFNEWQDITEGNQQYNDYDSRENPPNEEIQPEIENQRYRNPLPNSYETSTIEPLIDTTENPNLSYYTKQEEQLLDDVTREYFTNFGKKLRGQVLSNTTPVYRKTTKIVTEKPDFTIVQSFLSNDYDDLRKSVKFKAPKVKVHYGDHTQKPFSLQDDTRINYKDPLPPIDPNSEWIPGFDPNPPKNHPQQNYDQQRSLVDDHYVQKHLPIHRLSSIVNYPGPEVIQRSNVPPNNFFPISQSSRDNSRSTFSNVRLKPISLESDIDVNYRDPQRSVNPDAEYIDPSIIRSNNNNVNDNNNNNSNNNNQDKGLYFAYKLPGDSGHFYFQTPQVIDHRQDDNSPYFYPRNRGSRFLRQRTRGARNS